MNLPELDGTYTVAKEQIENFRRDGYVVLPHVASKEEIEAWRPAILEARNRHGQEVVPLDQRDTYGKAFLKGINLWACDTQVKQFVTSPRFARIAADLMGVDAVRIYHDQALIKEPGGGITPWHQDQHYWPLDTGNTVTMWMPLVDVIAEMGSMRFACGSHREGYLGDAPIGDASEVRFESFIREHGFRVEQVGALEGGDASFHYGWTLHGAPANSTNRTREVMTVIWFADGARVTAPDNPNRHRDRNRWLNDIDPGEPAAGPLNPVVFDRRVHNRSKTG
jgi:ectoine hydroxylase-related dioxygenase (phytanoyl-CoA dioxygenase family)